jgi:hypothetical protein
MSFLVTVAEGGLPEEVFVITIKLLYVLPDMD